MRNSSGTTDSAATAGFSTIDDKGRIVLPKSVRSALGVHAGSSLAYIVLDDAVLFIPQDAHLAQIQQQAIQALTEAGMTADDLLDQLPEARDAVVREAYRPEFLAKLRQMRDERTNTTPDKLNQSEQAE